MSQQGQAPKSLRRSCQDLRPEPEAQMGKITGRSGVGGEREAPAAEWSNGTSTELKRR